MTNTFRIVDTDSAQVEFGAAGTAFVTCERIGPTLFIRPQIQLNGGKLRFTGAFVIGTGSGTGFPGEGCADCARRSAEQLAAIEGLDWEDEDVIQTATPKQVEQVSAALSPMWQCEFNGTCPEERFRAVLTEAGVTAEEAP